MSPGALTDPFRDIISNNKDLVVAAALQKRADGSHCVLETTGRSDLVPDFTKASQKESNILSLFPDIPLCNSDEEELIRRHAESAFLKDEGIQVAAGPLVPIVIAGAALGCALGTAISYTDNSREDTEYVLGIGKDKWIISAAWAGFNMFPPALEHAVTASRSAVPAAGKASRLIVSSVATNPIVITGVITFGSVLICDEDTIYVLNKLSDFVSDLFHVFDIPPIDPQSIREIY